MPLPPKVPSASIAIDRRNHVLELIQNLAAEFDALYEQCGLSRSHLDNTGLAIPASLDLPAGENAPRVESEVENTAAQKASLSEETIGELLDSTSLSPQEMNELRINFDLLDTDEDAEISLDQCASLVEEFTQTKLDHHSLTMAFVGLEMATRGHDQSKASRCGSFEEITINFNRFLLLMNSHKLPSNFAAAHRVLETCNIAFKRAIKFKQDLALEKLRRAAQHERLAHCLDLAPLPIILLNTVAIGLEFDVPEPSIMWRYTDICFMCCYIVEAVVKLYVFGATVYFTGPDQNWHCFDILLICVAVLDNVTALFWRVDIPFLGDLMLLKLLRLLKLARLIKAVGHPMFAELRQIIMGVVSGSRTLFWALILLLVFVYFLGVFATALITDMPEFTTVSSSMFTIFRCFTDGCAAYDGTPLSEKVRETYGAWFSVLYVLITMLVTFGMFNMIMAIFIENVVAVGVRRRQEDLGNSRVQNRYNLMEGLVGLILQCKMAHGQKHHLLTPREKAELKAQWETSLDDAFLAMPPDLSISRDIFNAWVKDPHFVRLLENSGIDISNALHMFDALDADMSGFLTPDELLNGLMALRGPITKCDIIDVKMKVIENTKMLQNLQSRLSVAC